MNADFVGLLGVVLIVLIAEGVATCLRRPLGALLKLEKGVERSEFWNTYIRLALLLVPASFALMSFPNSPLENPIAVLVGQLRWGLVGLLITLVVAGHSVRVPAPPRPYVPYSPPVAPPVANGTAR